MDEATQKLFKAVRAGRSSLYEDLLNEGAKVNAADENGNRPLHIVAEKGIASGVDFFVKHGANVNARNKRGETPLHVAAAYSSQFSNQTGVVYSLVQHGADVLAIDNNGQLPRDRALESGHTRIMEALKDAVNWRKKGLDALPESELVKRRETVTKVARMLDAELQRRAQKAGEHKR